MLIFEAFVHVIFCFEAGQNTEQTREILIRGGDDSSEACDG